MEFNGFSDFSLRASTVHMGERCWYAHFKTDIDFSDLIPFLCAVVDEAIHFENPEHLQFRMDGVFYALYPPDRVVCRFFDDRDDALSSARRIISLLNDVENRKYRLNPRFNICKRPQVPEILRLLPITNCGECGLATCMAFAGAVSRMRTVLATCPYVPEPMNVMALYPVVDGENRLIRKIEIHMDLTGYTGLKNPRGRSKKQNPKEGFQGDRDASKSGVTGAREGIVFKLSGRETEVIRLMAQGFTNVEIAQILKISHHTVKSHVMHIFNKLGVDDRTQASVWAAQNELV